jgi:hypothetical protein
MILIPIKIALALPVLIIGIWVSLAGEDDWSRKFMESFFGFGH